MVVERALCPATRDRALPELGGRPARPAARHPARNPGRRPRSTTKPNRDGRSKPTTAIVITARFLVAATGCLSVPNTPQFEGLDDFRGELYHTATWPAAGVDVARKARRRDRHRVVGNPGDPRHRRDGARAHRVSSAPPTSACPPANGTSTPTWSDAGRTSLADWRRAAWNNSAGFDFQPAELSVDDIDQSTATAPTPSSIAGGGTAGSPRSSSPSTASSRTSRPTSSSPSTSAPRCARSSTTRPSPSCCAPRDHPIGTKRVCADTRVLRDVQPPQRLARRRSDDADRLVRRRRVSCSPTAATSTSTSSCWQPGSTR